MADDSVKHETRKSFFKERSNKLIWPGFFAGKMERKTFSGCFAAKSFERVLDLRWLYVVPGLPVLLLETHHGFEKVLIMGVSRDRNKFCLDMTRS